MKKIRLDLDSKKTQIWVGDRVLGQVGRLISKPHSKGFILADSRLKIQVRKLEHSLKSEGWETRVFFVEASEFLKSFQGANRIYEELLKFGADRHSVLFAVGGGVIGDLGGFVAGTYLRGIQWVGIPSTLLSQVDSSIGGKTGINHSHGKNLIGVFHQPIAVFCETQFLKTLPKRDIVSGFGEIIKYSLILDPKLFLKLEREEVRSSTFLGPETEKLITQCLKLKASIVQKDERDETGCREILNFGHTLGHAIEAETGYRSFRHGEAVILGMRAAVSLSRVRGHLSEKTFLRVDRFLKKFPVPMLPQKIRNDDLLKRLKWDKKSIRGRVRFVLLKEVGVTVLDHGVESEEINSALDWLRKG